MAIVRDAVIEMGDIQVIDQEWKLQVAFNKYLADNGFKDIMNEIDILWGKRIVDTIFLDAKRGYICCELKMTDWKCAIQQCKDIKQFYPNVYLVMPRQNSYRMKKIRTEVKAAGIGFYVFDNGSFSEERKPTNKLHNLDNVYTGVEIDAMAKNMAESIFDHFHFHFMMKYVEWTYRKRDQERIKGVI